MCKQCDEEVLENMVMPNKDGDSIEIFNGSLLITIHDTCTGDVALELESKTINYCPMCGRRLNNGEEI